MILDLKECGMCGIQVLHTSIQILNIPVIVKGKLQTANVPTCSDCRLEISNAEVREKENEENIQN